MIFSQIPPPFYDRSAQKCFRHRYQKHQCGGKISFLLNDAFAFISTAVFIDWNVNTSLLVSRRCFRVVSLHFISPRALSIYRGSNNRTLAARLLRQPHLLGVISDNALCIWLRVCRVIHPSLLQIYLLWLWSSICLSMSPPAPLPLAGSGEQISIQREMRWEINASAAAKPHTAHTPREQSVFLKPWGYRQPPWGPLCGDYTSNT